MTEKINWDLADIYKNDENARDDLNSIKELLEDIKELKSNPKENLIDLIIKDNEISRKIEKLYSYSHMKKDEDSNVSKYQKLEWGLSGEWLDGNLK